MNPPTKNNHKRINPLAEIQLSGCCDPTKQTNHLCEAVAELYPGVTVHEKVLQQEASGHLVVARGAVLDARHLYIAQQEARTPDFQENEEQIKKKHFKLLRRGTVEIQAGDGDHTTHRIHC